LRLGADAGQAERTAAMMRTWTVELQMWLPRVLLALVVTLLGVALALLPWQWVLMLVSVPAAMVTLLIRPQLALCLLAFAVPFGSIWQWSLGPINVGIADLLVLALSLSWAAKMMSQRRLVIPQPPLLVPVILLVSAFSLSTLSASSLALSAKELVKWLEVLAIYLFIAGHVDRRWGKWIVLSLLAAGSTEALFGVYQFFRRLGPEGFVLFGRFMRAYGHFAQPNPFAGYLGLVVPLAYALGLQSLDWLSGKVTRARAKTGGMLCGVVGMSVSWGSLAVILAAIMMSWSRGAWLGVTAALTVVTVVRSRRARVVLLGATVVAAYVLGAGGAEYLPSPLADRFSGLLPYVSGVDVTRVDISDANWAVIERTAHWLAAIGMFADHPWIGVGIGNYSVAYAQYALGRWQDPLGHAHNYYLNVAAEAGFLGLLAYLTLFGAAILQASHGTGRPMGAESEEEVSAYWRAVTLGGLGVLVHLSVHSLFDNLYVHSMNVQLGMVLGLLAIAQKDLQRDAHRV